jgi:hypothetical protein
MAKHYSVEEKLAVVMAAMQGVTSRRELCTMFAKTLHSLALFQ